MEHEPIGPDDHIRVSLQMAEKAAALLAQIKTGCVLQTAHFVIWKAGVDGQLVKSGDFADSQDCLAAMSMIAEMGGFVCASARHPGGELRMIIAVAIKGHLCLIDVRSVLIAASKGE